MNVNAVTFPLVIAVVIIGLAVLPGMLADDGLDLTPDDQQFEMREIRSPIDDQAALRYLLQNFLDSRDTRGWSPIRDQPTKCVGDKCRYAWKRGFETPSARINQRGAPAWATSQFSSGGCTGASCLAGWKRGFRQLPQLQTEDDN